MAAAGMGGLSRAAAVLGDLRAAAEFSSAAGLVARTKLSGTTCVAGSRCVQGAGWSVERFLDSGDSKSGQRDANTLDTYAAAQAAVGRFGEAVVTAREALALADAQRDAAQAAAIRDRLAGYERGIAYTEPPAGR